jgi:transcriptional regulator with GAF, ATPase, and Fis domain
VKGAFTGADRQPRGPVRAGAPRHALHRRGRVDVAALQTKLLRALQEREVERLGDAKPLKVDIRVIAATNTDLKTMVKAGPSARTSTTVSTSFR